jgi:hypothetical protein
MDPLYDFETHNPPKVLQARSWVGFPVRVNFKCGLKKSSHLSHAKSLVQGHSFCRCGRMEQGFEKNTQDVEAPYWV